MDLQDVKDYLNITWSEKDIELTKIISRGQAYLNRIAGTELDFVKDESVKQLLLDYCRYVYNHSFEMFEINFKRELLGLSIREGVKSHVATNTETNP